MRKNTEICLSHLNPLGNSPAVPAMAKPIWEALIASADFREVADLTGRSAVPIRHLLQCIRVLKIISKLTQLELYWPIRAQSPLSTEFER